MTSPEDWVDTDTEAASGDDVPFGELQTAALASVANAVMVTDADGLIVWVNEAFTTMSGYSLDEARGHTPRLLKSGVQSAEHYTTLWSTIKSGDAWQGEVVNRHKGGRHYRVVQTITPVFNGGPSPTHFVAIHDDVTQQRHVEREQRFQAMLLDAVGEAVIATDRDGAIQYVNAAAERMFGWRHAEVLGTSVIELTVPRAYDTRAEQVLGQLREDRSWTGRFEVQRADGSRFPALVTTSPFRDEDGHVAGFIGVAVDITDQVGQEQQLDRRARQQALLAELGQRALEHQQADAVGEEAARQAAQLLGSDLKVEMVRGGSIPPRVDKGGEATTIPIDATARFRLTGQGLEQVLDQDLDFLQAVANTVRAARQRESDLRQLEHQATHDALTNLPNRVLLLDRLDRPAVAGRWVNPRRAVLLLDLDDFKVVNDSLGHHVGDELLQAVGQRLMTVVRPSDTVARLGGDEFAILCPDLDSEPGVRTVAGRIQAALNEGFVTSHGPVSLTASIGVAFGDASAEPDALLRDADTALYVAKTAGRNRTELFDQAMQDLAVHRFDVTNVLRAALASRQLVVEYQPSIELATGRIVGVEALVRLRRDDGALIAPDEFIAIAEDNGLIIELGRQVLDRACADAKHWVAGDPDFMLSVNLSPRQLTDPSTTQTVQDALLTNGLPPTSLWLEITETALVAGPAALETIQLLRQAGTRFAIDDFGTGYSSLAHLRLTPVDILKIDRSFVAGMHTDQHDQVLVRAVADLAKSFGLATTAEGVETARQAKELADIGCDFGQGYYWSRPVGPEQITRLLAKQ